MKMKRQFSFLGLVLFVILLMRGGVCPAQTTRHYEEPEYGFSQAVSLYESDKFAAAKRAFSAVQRSLRDDNEYLRSETMYYKAMCDVMLYHKSGAKALRDFVETYPNSNRVNSAYFRLANFEYDYKRYGSAKGYFVQVEPDDLDVKSGDVELYWFRFGYSAFMTKDYGEAKLCFSELTDHENRYQVVATYYYAYILYLEGYYQNALDYFERIEDDPAFANIVPLYMMQIYHVLGESDKVIEMGPSLMETASDKRAAEIGRLLGEAYYKKGRYQEALPYMTNFYHNSAEIPDAEGLYILGYCYYKLDYFDSAAYYFQGVMPLNPPAGLKQSTLYHLGYCYARQNKKKFAMDAFSEAAKIEGENAVVEEDALYHQAQLAYELGLNPYHESLKVLEDFLQKYPNSVYSKRIYTYMVRMYLTTRNYDMALASLSKIKERTPELNLIEQRLYFNKGVESYLRRAYGTALSFFEKCSKAGYDADLTARAYFWQGECHFSAGNYQNALGFYKQFLSYAGAQSLPEYANALLGMGYASMEMVNYPQAIGYFQKFAALDNSAIDRHLQADAYARLGDCQFMTEAYAEAVRSYDEASHRGYQPADYVLLQKSLCEGAMGHYEQKEKILLSVENLYVESAYMPQVYEELASTYLVMGQDSKALQYYRKLRDFYPNSPKSLSAWARMGLIYYNQGNNDQALQCFKVVAKANPSSAEGRQALTTIRNIYMSMNQIDKYFSYVASLPEVKLEQAEQDSLLYLTAENAMLENRYAEALAGLKTYLDTYPQGLFMVDAWKNAALCAEKIGDKSNMKNAYRRLSQLKVEESEAASLKLADLCYGDKEYKPALGYYLQAEKLASKPENLVAARLGKMKAYRALGQSKELVESALEVLRTDGITIQESDEARYYIAHAAPAIGENELSMQQYEALVKSANPDYSSEARYMLLEQRVKSGFYDEAERMILDYISSDVVNEYYLAKTYLLWADIYYQKGNVLQAKQTLQSIVDNYEGEDLKALARQKLEMIKQREASELEQEQVLRSSRYAAEEEIMLPPM